MSYLSPLPHYLQPRGRSRSWAHVLPAPLEEETWSDPRLHLHHPLHPERSYHIAGGHQRQFHDVTTIPSLVDLLSPARTSLAAPSKGALQGVDPQALQHAAARLRKTANSESLLLGSEDLPLSRRDWSNDPFNEPLGVDPSRATFPSPSSRPNDPRPLGDLRADSNSLNRLSSTPRPLVLEHSYAPSSSSFFSTHASSSSSCSTYPSQQHTPFAPFSPPSNFDSRNDFVHREPMIRDARDRIHAYATSTPVDDPFPAPPPSISSTLLTSSRNTRSDFVRELRDQSLTERQRAANLFRKERTSGGRLPFSVDEFYKRADTGDEVDALVRQLRRDLGSSATSTDVCVACGEAVSNSKPGCTALDSLYHVECFKCKTCDKPVAGESFYNVDGAPQCESCYNDALEKCTACGKTISDKLLRACGGQYHVGCFCCVKCSRVLDGVPFTLDSDNRVHCVPCFHDSFAPRCAVCSRPIIPQEGEKESVRVVAMDKSFHVQCYACEDCGVQLSSKVEGAGCYPLDSHLYCRTCNTNRLRLLSSV